MAGNARGPSGPGSTPTSYHLVVLILCNLALLLIYIWFVSIGTWTHWPTLTADYDQLATAFAHGHTWLDARPDPALLALSNPYDPAQRKGLLYPLDLSLYKGRFYLYFGPMPALLLLMAKVFVPGVIGDQYLVLAACYGIVIVQSLLIIKIGRRFFPEVGPGLLALCILAAGLIGPYTWLLGTPNVYNAAIMTGQFFFLTGLVVAFEAVDFRLPSWRLWVVGILWTAAVGSRIVVAAPIAVLLILLSLRMLARPGGHRLQFSELRSLLPVAIPLACGALLLGWYDWVRFGSMLETGLNYQLAGKISYQTAGMAAFSPAYLLQNLYSYLLNPFRPHRAFPYLLPAVPRTVSVIALLRLPAFYTGNPVTGLLWTSPFVLFALVPMIQLIRRFHNRQMGRTDEPAIFRLTGGLLAGCLPAAGVLLPYYFAAERFTIDFLPPLMLLSIIGFWQLNRSFQHPWFVRVLYTVLTAGIMGSSVIVSTLLAISINADGFRQLNPVLWRQLSNLVR